MTGASLRLGPGKKQAIERYIVDGGAKTKSYKQYLEIETARRRNGRVDRPGLDVASPQTSFGVRLSGIHFSPTDVC